MNLSKKNKNNHDIDIADLYAVKIGLLWCQLKKENLSFWFLCGYFLFEYVRPQSIYPALSIIPWAQLLLISSVCFAFFDKSVTWVGSIENKLLNLFSIVLVLSCVMAFKPSASWAMINIYVSWVIVYYLVVNIVNTERRMLLFVLLYLLFSFKMAQHGAIVWASRGFSFANWGLIGAGGWFQNSGEYAIQMLIFTSLSVGLIIGLKEHWGRYKKLFFYLMPLTGVLAVMGASSRGSQLALAVIGLWLLIKSKQKLKGIVILTVLGVMLLAVLPDEQLQRFHDIGEDKTSLQRLIYWRYGMDMVADHPVFGIGYYNWLEYLSFKEPGGIGVLNTIQVAHNIYIQVAAELGMIGLLVFALMVIFVFIINMQTRIRAKKVNAMLWYYLAYGIDAGLVGYLVAGFFVTVFFYPFFWVQMGFAVMLHNVVHQLELVVYSE